MHATDVIRKPLVTEKAASDSAEHNRFAFEVDRRATKDQIRKADPSFSEKRFGFGGFLQFAKAAKNHGHVTLEWDDKVGDYVVGLPG